MTIQVDGHERLSLDEIALLREVARWRRKTGGEYVPQWPEYRLTDRRMITWLRPQSQAIYMKIGVTPDHRSVPLVWHRVASVAQAINLLVALGYLPDRFSSAYRAGWDARSSYEAYHEDPDTLSRIAGGEARPDFPAWRPVW